MGCILTKISVAIFLKLVTNKEKPYSENARCFTHYCGDSRSGQNTHLKQKKNTGQYSLKKGGNEYLMILKNSYASYGPYPNAPDPKRLETWS